jgi:hypothetical protein
MVFKTFIIIWIFYFLTVDLYAQQLAKSPTDDKAYKILDKAIGEPFASENMAIYFESLAFDVEKPESIFTLPVYQVYKGGFVMLNKDKYQVELGLMKSMSDGKLMVIVEEKSKTMIVDSVRKGTKEEEQEEMDAFLKDDFLDGTLDYLGTVMINDHSCHKIKSTLKNSKEDMHVLYWVDVQSGQLYLMAEHIHNAYNVYWVSKVSKTPENHTYDIYLPKKGVTSFHGYKVIDRRFSNIED